jgi:hypothetical protein
MIDLKLLEKYQLIESENCNKNYRKSFLIIRKLI